MEKKHCIECNEPIQGRSDKKFCSDMCRNSYNNKLNSDVTNHMRHVNNILRRNRRILQELSPEGKISVHRDKLVDKGFNFNYFTSIYKNKKGDIYHYCYEYGYVPSGENFYLLVVSNKALD